MGRMRRESAPDGVHHVTTRGNERRAVFRDDRDRRAFLDALHVVVVERGWDVGTYCLMPNHVHLVLRAPQGDLSAGMRDLLSAHARAFNGRHERVGHLFAGRFNSCAVRRDAHHLELHRYVALNPVRAGLVAAPAAFPWSAHAALLGLRPKPAFLGGDLEPFGGDRARYAAFVAEGVPEQSLLAALVADGRPERLRAAADAGFSQAAIAAVLGLTQSAVSRRLRD